ncbi:MAG: hypothetical protein ACRENQ_02345, partial [Gemmatimonadaceae bacterium]
MFGHDPLRLVGPLGGSREAERFQVLLRDVGYGRGLPVRTGRVPRFSGNVAALEQGIPPLAHSGEDLER